jgi:hypothetical protein
MSIHYRRASDLTVSRRVSAVGVKLKVVHRPLAFVAATLIAGAMLTWVAIMNGYPVIFGDSARYLNGGILRYIPSEAPIFYGAFMIPLHLNGVSLWPVVAAQCLLLAYVIGASLRALGLFEERSFVLLAAFLALFTAAPWFTAFIMPDIFAPICVLAMFALFRGWEGFAGLERFVLAGLALLALASHVTHIIVGLALVALFGALRLCGRPVSSAALLTVLPLPLVALGATVGINLITKGRPIVTQDGPVFLLARTFADGPAYDYLRTHCGERRWKVCERLESLPRDSELFLWSPDKSVWSSTTSGAELRAEAAEIVAGTLREHPIELLRAAIGNTLRQLVTFRAGVDFRRWAEIEGVLTLPGVVHRFFPQEFDSLMQGRQQQGRLDATAANYVYSAIVVMSAAGLLLLLALRERPDPGLAEFFLVVAIALVVNAAATGALSVVADRYQARLVWLVPLAFALSLLAHRRRLASPADAAARPFTGG